MKYLRAVIKRILWYIKDIRSVVCRRADVPLKYFSGRENVGDALNPYLISKITNKETYEVKTNVISHVLGIGSIMHFASSKSIVWGSGVIHPNRMPDSKVLKKLKITALRGVKTRALLLERGVDCRACPLGDPAVLMPLFYKPAVIKKFLVGVVPHYVDQKHEMVRKLGHEPGVTIIDVADSPEDFVNRLCECDIVISSSLHGLILSDAYNVPNIWVVFSDEVIGGDFKFLDYYSTTDTNIPNRLSMEKVSNIDQIMDEVLSRARVSHFSSDKQELLAAFPEKFLS